MRIPGFMLTAFALAVPTLIACGITAGAPALAQAQHGGGLQLEERASFPAGDSTVRVPFRLHGEHVLVPVGVNGSEPLWLVLDTGMPTPGVVLYERPEVTALGLAYGPMRVRVGGAGGQGTPTEARLAQDVALRVGGLEVAGSVAIVLPPIRGMSELHAGIIGMSLFRNCVVSVDHDRGELVLTDSERFVPPPSATAVRLHLERNSAYLEAQLAGADGRLSPLRLIVDLGATHAVSLNARANAAVQVPKGAITTRTGRGLSGPITGRVGRIPALVLGGHRMANLVATFPDSAFENPRGLDARDGNLGLGVLSRFNLSFDYRKSTLHLVPNRRFTEPSEWDMTGAVFEPGEDGGLSVVQLLPGSAAEVAGVRPGDVLVSLDGEPASIGILFARGARMKRDGAIVPIVVRRGTVEHKLRLTLKRLV